MTEQRTFGAPLGSIWNPGPPDVRGYLPPACRPGPVLSPEVLAACRADSRPVVTVLGTVRDERLPFLRSASVWARQRLPSWLSVEFLVLDDGSSDRVDLAVAELASAGLPFRYVRWREPGDPAERSCTVVFNAAIRRGLVRSPLVVSQWWDRIPGSFDHLAALVAPHRSRAAIATSATSRHVGASSSVAEITPERLATILGMIDWRAKPEQLALGAGPIGAHCVAGQATESSGLCVAVAELVALGGWDERYGATRHGYPNVDLWRRILGSGLTACFPPEPVGANYHQSHPAGTREGKDTSLLADVSLVRNGGPAGRWGNALPIEVAPPTDPWATVDARRLPRSLFVE